ncbi:MAG: tetratricopeptide (TPR) repeat protein [Planctomycetota bacterium]|jgi:tetratricopeptide (TPR) repeat protein
MSIRLTDLLRDRTVQGLLLLAVVVRLVIGINIWNADPLVQVPLSDPAYYHIWASALSQGEGFRDAAPFWLPPLYPWVLGALYRIVGISIGVVVLVQGALGLLSTALLMLASHRTLGRRAAIAAGALWTFYAPVVFFETRLLPVNLAILLGLVALNLLIRFEQNTAKSSPSSGGLLLPTIAGLFIGFASMARPNLLLTAPLVAGALLLSKTHRAARFKGSVLVLVGLLIGLAPSTFENYSRGGELIPVTANGGVNFWFGNNEHARGTFHAPSAEWGSIGTQRDVSIGIASQALGAAQPVSEAEASSWWFARGRQFIFDSPSAALRLWGLKLADTLSSTEFGIQYFPAAIRRLAPSLWVGCLPFGLILALGIIGLSSKFRPSNSGATVLIAWLIAGLSASLLYFTYSRFRLPILIAWMPFAGNGLIVIFDAFKGRERLPTLRTLIASMLLGISFVPFEGGYPRLLEANTLLDAGLAAGQLGDASRSIELVESSLELVPVNPRAETELGKLLLALGKEQQALPHFELAWRMPGAYPPALFELCRLLVGAESPAVSDPARAVELMRVWLGSSYANQNFALSLDLQILLATALIDRPQLAASANEAREITQNVLSRNPAHPAALQVLDYLDGR